MYWVTLDESAALPGVSRKFQQIRYGLQGKIPDGMLVVSRAFQRSPTRLLRCSSAFWNSCMRPCRKASAPGISDRLLRSDAAVAVSSLPASGAAAASAVLSCQRAGDAASGGAQAHPLAEPHAVRTRNKAEGRANERHRRVALTAAASPLAKVLTVGSALVSVPLDAGLISGRERFSMWMTISSLIAMLAFADFGIANGLLNTVSSAHGRDENVQAIRRAVSSGFFLLGTIGTTLLIAFATVYVHVPWASFFNVTTAQAAAEAGPALAVFVCCFAANIPLALVQQAHPSGLPNGFIASLWQCVGSVCGLLGVLWAIHMQASLPGLVLALAGVPVLSAMLNSLHFFLRARRDLLPRWVACFGAGMPTNSLRTGSLFFVLQIVVAVAYSSDSFIIAQLKGAGAVADYAVPEKLFSLVPLLMTMVLMPLWPAYGEAIARGDTAWVRITLKRSIVLAAGSAAVMAFLLVLLAPQILHWWVGSAVAPPLLLLVAFGAWKVIEAAGSAFGNVPERFGSR